MAARECDENVTRLKGSLPVKLNSTMQTGTNPQDEMSAPTPMMDFGSNGTPLRVPVCPVFPTFSLFSDVQLLNPDEYDSSIDFATYQGRSEVNAIAHHWNWPEMTRWNSVPALIQRQLRSAQSNKPQLMKLGLYTPVPPHKTHVLLRNTSRVSERVLYEAAANLADAEHANTKQENRLLSVANMFSREFLRAGTDPLERHNLRPPIFPQTCTDRASHRNSLHLELDVQLPGHNGNFRNNKLPSAELKLFLMRVALYEHPLFSPEDRLYAQLRLLYGEYHRQLKIQKWMYLRQRFQALIISIEKRQLGMQVENRGKLLSDAELCDESIQVLCLLAAEAQSATKLAECLYTTWNQLKGLRQHQHFISTPAKLVAINVHHMCQTSQAPMAEDLMNSFEARLGWITQHSCQEMHHDYLFSLCKKYRRVLTSGSDFVLKLYTTAELTYDDDKSLPVQEIRRRRRVRQQRLYAVLAANGRRVAVMQSLPIEWPAFTMQLEQSLRLRVFNRPHKLELQLWQRRIVVDLYLATILIPMPGMCAYHDKASSLSLSPMTDWIQFSSSCVFWDVKFAIGDDVDILLDVPRKFPRSGQLNKNVDAWVPGVVVAVKWRCYDVHVQNRLQRGIEPSRLRRTGAISEVCRRHLTGAILISLQWVPIDLKAEHLSTNRSKIPHPPARSNTVSQLNSKRILSYSAYHMSDTGIKAFRSDETQSRFRSYPSNEQSLRCQHPHHKLLRLRAHQPHIFYDPIPLSDAMQTDAWLLELLMAEDRRCRRVISRCADNMAKSEKGVQQRDNRRILVFAQQVQDSVSEKKGALKSTQRPLAALVSEGAPLPELRTRGLVNSVLDFAARRRRALRPLRQRRVASAAAGECSILVQVISAHYSSQMTQHSDSHDNSPGTRGLNESGSFVSATFQEHHRRTMLAVGMNPRWKEILDLPFFPALGDFSPTNLMQTNDSLLLGLFVEWAGRTANSRNGSSDVENTLFHRKFIGDVEIPFTTLYCNGGTEGWLRGMFKLRTPFVHFTGDDNGIWNKGISHAIDPNNNETKLSAELAARGSTHLHVAIFLRPLLVAPSVLPSFVSSIEDSALIRYGVHWVQQLRLYLENICNVMKRPVNDRIPKRIIEVFGNNMHGDAILICRYLHPQRPPVGVDTYLKAARFVSLIPFLDDWQSFGCANLDVWCTSQEFLDIGAGDWEEHGILLHNLLWWLQLHGQFPNTAAAETFHLIIGSGIPEGNTVYVLQQTADYTPDAITLWNACVGCVFSAEDKRCPLVDIGCIVTSQNIYANIQGVTSLNLLSFDYHNTEGWRPFFADDPRVGMTCLCACNPGPMQMCRPPSLASVQETELRYDAPDVIHAEEIQSNLAHQIKVWALS